jgi:hypothetical protein
VLRRGFDDEASASFSSKEMKRQTATDRTERAAAQTGQTEPEREDCGHPSRDEGEVGRADDEVSDERSAGHQKGEPLPAEDGQRADLSPLNGSLHHHRPHHSVAAIIGEGRPEIVTNRAAHRSAPRLPRVIALGRSHPSTGSTRRLLPPLESWVSRPRGGMAPWRG